MFRYIQSVIAIACAAVRRRKSYEIALFTKNLFTKNGEGGEFKTCSHAPKSRQIPELDIFSNMLERHSISCGTDWHITS